MTALIDRIGTEVTALDGFCGFGGSSQGIHAAGATVIAAFNHSELNIECHGTNFPDTEHWIADVVDDSDPQMIDKNGRKVPGRYLDPADLPAARFAWFSPSCTHHSQANSTKIFEQGHQRAMFEDDEWDEQAYVNSERSRVTMSCVLRYAERNRPEIIVVENVVEVTKWGPGKDGSTFRWWMNELDKMGYEIKPLYLNSMFFGPCPQSRDRVYIVAWRKGNVAPDLDYRPTACCTSDRCSGAIVQAVQTWKPRKKTWMMDQWGKYLDQYDYRCPVCKCVVHPASWMALSAIDWTNLGPSIEDRLTAGKTMAPATMERIRRAVQKYRSAPPIILPGAQVSAEQVLVAHGETVSTGNAGSAPVYAGNRSRSVGEQLPTLAQRNTIGVAVHDVTALALTIKNNGKIDEAQYRAHHAGDPLGSIVGSGRPQSVLALILPNRTNNVAHHAGEPTPPVMTSATVGVVVAAAGNTSERPGQTRARSVNDPLFTQSTTNEFGVASVTTLRGGHTQDVHVVEPLDTISAGGNHQAAMAPRSVARHRSVIHEATGGVTALPRPAVIWLLLPSRT